VITKRKSKLPPALAGGKEELNNQKGFSPKTKLFG
jgi:hypothetical protein